MRSILHLFLLLFALSSWGQPAPINRRAMAIAGLAGGGGNPYSPLDTNSIAYWWAGDDILVGTNNALTNWVDRIQHYAWLTNGTASQSPTWDGSGVVFASANSQRLMSNGAATSWNGNNSQVLLVSKQTTSTGNRTYLSGNVDRFWVTVSGHWNNGFPSAPTIANGYFYDLLYAGSFGGASNEKYYTNGILYLSGASGQPGGNGITKVGCFHNGGAPTEFINATIRELIVWTNNVNFTNANSAVTLSNVHYYVTNKYHDITP